jgi:hypothetical protein
MMKEKQANPLPMSLTGISENTGNSAQVAVFI